MSEYQDWQDDVFHPVPDESEPEPEQVQAPSGPYTAGRHFVLRDGAKVAACYPMQDLSAEQVAQRIAKAMNDASSSPSA